MTLRRRPFLGLAALAGALPLRPLAAGAAQPSAEDVLTAAAAQLFPHEAAGAARYRAIAAAFRAQNAAPAARLVAALGGPGFAALPPAGRRQKLVSVQQTADFLAYRLHVLVGLYGDPALVAHFGYEGPSLERGGYLAHGFDDLRWLPEPPRG